MPIIQVPVRKQPKRHRASRLRGFCIGLLVVLIAGGIYNYARPLPRATSSVQSPKLPLASVPPLVWPAQGQAAVGAEGFDILATSGNQVPVATASIAKVITALCVLQKQPLATNQSGPTYTVGPTDVGIYNDYVSKDGSNIPVALGETLTEYQALEALMLPSANNIADSLAIWAFGNQANYAAFATQYISQHGLVHTHIGSDASGFDSSTTSTANDLVRLGLLAQQNPVLMQIASERTTTLPVVGTVYNYDTILGVNGITGLKTGNSDADPGAFLFTATTSVGTQQLHTTGAILGSANLNQALQSARVLAGSLQQAFDDSLLIKAHQTVGTVRTAWGEQTPIVATKDVRLLRWKGSTLAERHSVQPTTANKSTVVGAMELTADGNEGSTPLAIQTPVAGPSFWWRLTRH